MCACVYSWPWCISNLWVLHFSPPPAPAIPWSVDNENNHLWIVKWNMWKVCSKKWHLIQQCLICTSKVSSWLCCEVFDLVWRQRICFVCLLFCSLFFFSPCCIGCKMVKRKRERNILLWKTQWLPSPQHFCFLTVKTKPCWFGTRLICKDSSETCEMCENSHIDGNAQASCLVLVLHLFDCKGIPESSSEI